MPSLRQAITGLGSPGVKVANGFSRILVLIFFNRMLHFYDLNQSSSRAVIFSGFAVDFPKESASEASRPGFET